MFSEVECDEVEDGEGSEESIFTVKTLISEMVSLGEGETVGVKVLFIEDWGRNFND